MLGFGTIGEFAIGEFADDSAIVAANMILLQSVVTPLERTSDGEIIRVAMLPWQAILAELARDPNFLHSLDWRKMEELVAGAYKQAGSDEVILTPRSGLAWLAAVLDSDKVQHKIRLAGIDAPEESQAFGTKAKEALAEKMRSIESPTAHCPTPADTGDCWSEIAQIPQLTVQ